MICGPNWVGDAVLSVPAMKAVRALFPDAEITLLVRPWVAGLFGSAPFIDSVWSRKKVRGFREWVQMAKEIRQKDFDLALLFPNSFGSALTAWTGGIPQRVGYSTDRRGLLLTRSTRPSPEKQHQAQYYLGLVENMFGSVSQPTIEIEATEKERVSARRLLEQEGVDPEAGFVVVTPGAAFGSAKRWYETRFAEVADRLVSELGLAIVVVGSESERLIGEKVRDGMRNPAAVLSGLTSLETLVGLLAQASLMITNDSGPMHIASALGIPTVAVFGPTDAEATYPLGPRTRVVRHAVQCSPCLLRECPTDHRCMDRVTVDEVFEAAMSLQTTSASPRIT